MVGVFTPVGVLVVPEWGRGRLARGESVWRVVCGAIGSAALAGVPAKMVQDRADSGGFPADTAAAAAVVAATGGSGPGGTGGVNMWEPRQGSERGERWSWAWL